MGRAVHEQPRPVEGVSARVLREIEGIARVPGSAAPFGALLRRRRVTRAATRPEAEVTPSRDTSITQNAAAHPRALVADDTDGIRGDSYQLSAPRAR